MNTYIQSCIYVYITNKDNETPFHGKMKGGRGGGGKGLFLFNFKNTIYIYQRVISTLKVFTEKVHIH